MVVYSSRDTPQPAWAIPVDGPAISVTTPIRTATALGRLLLLLVARVGHVTVEPRGAHNAPCPGVSVMSTTQEQLIVKYVNLNEPWALIERFSSLVRESGSKDEKTAAAYISKRLAALGVPHEVHWPELYLSLPREASVGWDDGRGTSVSGVYAKTPSFSVSTVDESVPDRVRRGQAVYVPSAKATGIGDLFAGVGGTVPDLRGRVAVTDGLPMPAKVLAFQERGAVAAIFISPGERIHEAICTPVWGTPDLTTEHRRPAIAVASVSATDGARLVEAIAAAGAAGATLEAEVRTRLEEGWCRCPLVVAEIRGTTWPDEFVLVHGHLDSWHVGIGDNAVGNAALLELARVLWISRDSLPRTVRIAWWPGHSTGRYAGSTWYADRFARELRANCIVHMNCDSPGCRWASVFENLTCMAETKELAIGAVRDAAQLDATTSTPERAGDLSFSSIGVPTLFMLSSTIPAEERAKRGLYAVGGCGGNNEWHTEADTMEIADRGILLRDMRVYALATWRAAALPVHPLDYRAAVSAAAGYLGAYAERLGDGYDLAAAKEALGRLAAAVDGFYTREVKQAMAGPGVGVSGVNAKLRRLSRLMVSLMYSQVPEHRQDPALPVHPLPDVAAAAEALEGGRTDPGFIRMEVARAQNRIIQTVDQALELLGGK